MYLLILGLRVAYNFSHFHFFRLVLFVSVIFVYLSWEVWGLNAEGF